ncbi:hypothetical protein FRB95_009669 [Tulasnella sp. JGI-2019a]|nr:hypothetical protein FRB95_009669 [Tulasnella sp. JGI-2019a]
MQLVLDQSSIIDSYNGRSGRLQQAGQMSIIHDMDIDMDAPMSNTPQTPSAVARFGLLSIEPGGSAMPPGNTPVSDLPRLVLSSSDSHLVTVQKRVAPGHYGDMYQGLHTPTKLKLAMKRPRILDEGTIQAVDVKRRYEREARIWSTLNHVNVLPFYGVVKISSAMYLVAPWVIHGDLSRFLADRLECLAHPSLAQDSVSVQKRAAFLCFDEATTIHGIASGLAYIHACGVIHGDIKAANVLLPESLTPLLGDFGLAKKDEVDGTSPGLKGDGTARWKSPGLNNGESRTTKTDIYALGMTIVEILTGREPFPQLRSSAKVYVAISRGHRPPFEPISRNGKDFRSLWELAESCWQQEPDNRPTAVQVMGYAAHLLLNGNGDGNDVRQAHNDGTCNSLSEAYTIYMELGDRGMMAHCLKSVGEIKETQGRYDDACASLSEAALIYTAIGDRSRLAYCLKSIGEIEESQGKYENASASLINASVTFGALGDRSMSAHCLKSIGEIKETQGHYDTALIFLNEAHTVFREFGDRGFMAHSLRSIGSTKRKQGRDDDACASLKEAAAIYKELNDQRKVAHCLKSIVKIKETQKYHDDACSLLRETAAIYNALGDQSRVAHCIKSIGETKEYQGLHDDACTSLNEAAAIYKELGDQGKMVHCLHSIVEIKADQEHLDDACTSLSEVYTICKRFGDQSTMAYCLKSVGETKNAQRLYDDAFARLSEAAAIYKELGDQSEVAECLKSIGAVRSKQGNYDDARTWLSEAAATYRELGESRQAKGECDNALASFSEAAAIYKKFGDRSKIAQCLLSIGVIQHKKEEEADQDDGWTENWDKDQDQEEVEAEAEGEGAFASLSEAHAIYKELGDRGGMSECLYFIALIKKRQRHFDDACNLLTEVAVIFKGVSDQTKVAECLWSIARIRNRQKQYDVASASIDDAYTIYKELGDQVEMAICLNFKGLIKRYQHKYDDACALLREEIVILRELGDRHWYGSMAYGFKAIGATRRRQGWHDEAITSFSEAYTIFKENNLPYEMVRCLRSIGEIRQNQGLHDDAFTWLSKAWVIAEEDQHSRELRPSVVRVVKVLLDVWRQSNDTISKSNEPYELLGVLNETRGMVDSLCRIGEVRYDDGLYGKAMTSFSNACRLLKELGCGLGSVESLCSLAVMLPKQVKHIRSLLLRLDGAPESIDTPGPGEANEERYVLVLRMGRLLRNLGNLVAVPEQLRIDVAQLHVRVAIVFHTQLSHKERRSTLWEAGRLLQQPGLQFQVTESLTRLGDVLQKEGYIREANAVSEERSRVQLEQHEKMPLNEWLEVARRRVWGR